MNGIFILIWSGEKYLSSGIKYKSAAGAGVMVQTTVQGGGGNPKNVGYFPSNGLCFLLMLEGGKEETLSQLSLLTRILYFFFFTQKYLHIYHSDGSY